MYVTFDPLYFNIQHNSQSLAPTNERVFIQAQAGDLIRVSTTYERNFFVNEHPIGLFDAEDDAMYQNVYTLIPEEADSNMSEIRVVLNGGFDELPYSVADAHIFCPVGFHFFKSSSAPKKISIPDFRAHEKLWDIGDFVTQLGLTDFRYKLFSDVEDYRGRDNICGVVAKNGKFCWVHQWGNDGRFEVVEFSSLTELSDKISIELCRYSNR